jgi:hypothetical protein
MREIVIRVGPVEARAELLNTPTADAIWKAIPFRSPINTWGDEIYFPIPVRCELEPDATDEMPVGSLAYWKPGNAFCILFGPTPVSRGATPCLLNPGNRFGRILGDPHVFRCHLDGATIAVEKAQPCTS